MIPCTIWHKSNGIYDGIVYDDDGKMTVIKTLAEKYATPDRVKSLIKLGSLSRISDSLPDCVSMDGGQEMIFRGLPESQAFTVASSYAGGAYSFVFDEDTLQWWVGFKMNLPLLSIMNR